MRKACHATLCPHVGHILFAYRMSATAKPRADNALHIPRRKPARGKARHKGGKIVRLENRFQFRQRAQRQAERLVAAIQSGGDFTAVAIGHHHIASPKVIRLADSSAISNVTSAS